MQLGSIARWLKGDSRFWEGERFTVAVEGRGERDVVFVHGLAASPECWEEAPARLGPDMRLHFVHMRGFAGLPATGFREPGNFLKPTADALAAYIRANCRGPAAVVGHSMGGILSLVLARDHADVVERLMVADVPAFFSVLINPFATPKTVSGLAEASRRNYLDKGKEQLADDLHRATEKLVVDGGMLERIVRWGVASDRATVADVMAEVMVTDLRGDLHLIEAPVDVVYAWDKSGHATKVALDQVYGSAYHGLKQGRRLRIDHARHYVMLD
ncbi:MAG TPA: alpha/beta hydrolase, partial [Hyphomonadaceae bacterium]|nr:alpha/beta hydrolase [Hyphomonadaceae bacterium]